MAFKGQICYNEERIRIMKGGTQGAGAEFSLPAELCGKTVKTLIMYTSKHHEIGRASCRERVSSPV